MFTVVLLTSLRAQMGSGLVWVTPESLRPSLLRELGPGGAEVAKEMVGDGAAPSAL